jgi:solute carrier family 25 phosphate transporter 23/24/25/41
MKHVTTDATRRMICGGLAGMIAKTATNPLERIKMLSQTGEHSLGGGSVQAPSSSRPSVVGLYGDIIKNEGIQGLWAGNGVNLLRVFPAKAVVFASNDAYRHLFSQLSTSSSPASQHHSTFSPPLSGSLSFLAGGCAGMTASAVTYPLDFARGRISGKLGIGGQKAYGGIVQTIVLTVKDEGFLALYKGMTPTLVVRVRVCLASFTDGSPTLLCSRIALR